MRKRFRRGISLGTIVMLACTIGVLAAFAAMMPAFTGSQDILIDAARLAVAIDDSLSQLSASTGQMIQQHLTPQTTFVPPFTSQQAEPSISGSAAPTPVPTPTVSPKRTFSLCAAGTIELDASVRKALTIQQAERFELLTDQIPQALEADISILTLQNTFSASNDLSNVNMPVSFLTAIRSTGANAINLGHAYALNFGREGLLETASAIEDAGMSVFGAGEAAMRSVNGVQIALLHYQERISSTGQKRLDKTEREALLPPIETTKIVSDIENARQSGANVVIVTRNWGPEGKHDPSAEQIKQAQAIADAGADIILGTGNGALQPVQVLAANRGDGKYHPVLCAYSLGNLFSPDRESRVTLSSILLKTNVVYDTSNDTVAFDQLTYTPTYAWRGKDEGKTIQRILINDQQKLPDFVDANQQGVMERCLTLVTDVMADSAILVKY